MVLVSGSRLGPYELLGKLGEGGMGEVYRARDTRLGRDVALKILPDVFAQDEDRLARFRREAQVLASLNHPNIAAIYGLEDSSAAHALVMELVEGPTLGEVIQGATGAAGAAGAAGPLGPGLQIADALPIARQIVDALEAAHEQGIIHRDLKPDNVKVRDDGTVKVLDFGLAKALSPEGSSSTASGSTSASMSPTLTSPAMTQAGMILGTAAYMSPEQARGKPVDKRADIWAFGVLLFEMLAGQRLFAGDTLSDSLAAVLTREPDWTMLPASTPPGVRRLLTRCLERDPRTRLRDIGDARPDLEDVVPAVDASAVAGTRPLSRALPWAVSAVLLMLAIWAFWSRSDVGADALGVTRLDIGFPSDLEPNAGLSGLSISPDGRSIVVIAAKDGLRRVFIREFDREDFREVPGTEGASAATFSPDSRSVAFAPLTGALTRISLADGERMVLADGVVVTAGIAWSPAGIVFTRDSQLWIVSADGGEPRSLTTLDLDRGELAHDHPVVLPGERFVLFSSVTAKEGSERIEAVSLDSGARSVVVERAIGPVWSPTGHLLFGRDGAVLAVAFDPESASVRGEAVPILPRGVVRSNLTGALGLTVSETGTLLYVPNDFLEKRVVSVGRDGGERVLDLPSGAYSNPRVSPDGQRLLLETLEGVIQSLDLARGTRRQLAAGAFGTTFATWTSDGTRVVVRRFAAPFWIAADGSAESAAVPDSLPIDYPSSAGPDADSAFVVRIEPETAGDIFLLSLSGAFPPRRLIATPGYDGGAQLSPDGRWLLYQSNQSGETEVYVRRYPALDVQYSASAGGGFQVRWSRSGREIYYRNGQSMMAVTIDTSGPEPVFGTPTTLFTGDYDVGLGVSIPNYDVTSDGRFIMLRRGAGGGQLHVVINWTEELERTLESDGR